MMRRAWHWFGPIFFGSGFGIITVASLWPFGGDFGSDPFTRINLMMTGVCWAFMFAIGCVWRWCDETREKMRRAVERLEESQEQ